MRLLRLINTLSLFSSLSKKKKRKKIYYIIGHQNPKAQGKALTRRKGAEPTKNQHNRKHALVSLIWEIQIKSLNMDKTRRKFVIMD